MADEKILIGGEQYISSGRAAKLVGYTKDYVGQLARLGKIKATRVGRNWYINEDSINKHKVSVHYTLTKPKKKRSDSIDEKPIKNIDNSSLPNTAYTNTQSEKPKEDDADEEVLLFPRVQKPKRDPLLESDIRYEEHQAVKAERHEGRFQERRSHEQKLSSMPARPKPKTFQIRDIRTTEPRHTHFTRRSSQRTHAASTAHPIDGIVLTKKTQQTHHQRRNDVLDIRSRQKPQKPRPVEVAEPVTHENEPYDEVVYDTDENSKVFPVVGAIIIFTIITVLYILFFM